MIERRRYNPILGLERKAVILMEELNAWTMIDMKKSKH